MAHSQNNIEYTEPKITYERNEGTQVDLDRAELHAFVIDYVKPQILFEPLNHALIIKIHTMLSGKFGLKYKFITKLYGTSTIRISANKKSNGIIYYMALALNGEVHNFSYEPWPTLILGDEKPRKYEEPIIDEESE
jgi:hypothetical protein